MTKAELLKILEKVPDDTPLILDENRYGDFGFVMKQQNAELANGYAFLKIEEL